jgi:hypothetical protein
VAPLVAEEKKAVKSKSAMVDASVHGSGRSNCSFQVSMSPRSKKGIRLHSLNLSTVAWMTIAIGLETNMHCRESSIVCHLLELLHSCTWYMKVF